MPRNSCQIITWGLVSFSRTQRSSRRAKSSALVMPKRVRYAVVCSDRFFGS
jgi:hypothetical protein